MLQDKLSWYLNRLRTMSVPEVAFRGQQFAQKLFEKRFRQGRPLPVVKATAPTRILGAIDYTRLQPLPDQLGIFGLELQYANPINWHLDPASGKEFPRAFAKSIDIRTGRYGSAKHTWEVNRLQFLTRIAFNYRITGQPKYLQLFRSHIESWVAENPYLVGVNWYSNIEVNLRLITWFLAWEILDVNQIMSQDVDFKGFVEKCWVPTIYQHCVYSHANPSYFSSANNHLISEYAGLFIAASFWQFPESANWVKEAKAGLEREILLQHTPSGVNKEEAAEYIQFITDFFLLAFVVGERTGNPFSDSYKQQLRAIFHYIHELAAANGKVFFYGDEDDGKTFLLNTEADFDNFRSLFASGAVIFGEAGWKAKSAGYDTKNRLLFGDEGARIFESLPVQAPSSQSAFFADRGHFLLKTPYQGHEIYVHVDAAPLGFLSIAAHGHADALSFTLAVDGQAVFADPGTYTYHTEREWRNYFIGTLAHNTIRVDRQDQAKSTGPTMWNQHYEVAVKKIESTDNQDIIIASHNGYDHLGIRHEREFLFNKPKGLLTITDHVRNLDGKKHFLEIPFHLYPKITCIQDGSGKWNLKRESNWEVCFIPDPKLKMTLVRGQERPEILGWYSPSFQKKQPSPVLYSSLEITDSVQFKHEIQVVHK